MVDPLAHRELALAVLVRLREQGYQALWAGGCVRDQLLGRIPKDYDVATSATPDEIRDLFGNRRTLAIGAAFGVVAVLGPRDAGMIEVATFRRDAQYSDGRHPDAVVFSTAEEDAQRRDFTINGLFYDPLAEQVIDYVGGQEDLSRGIVRAIGDPRARLAEDKLRMIRAVRFAAKFDFALAPDTAAAIHESASSIHVVSSERIADEMEKILTHASRSRGLQLLARVGLLPLLVPELSELLPVAPADASNERWDQTFMTGAWQHVMAVMDQLEEPTFPLVLAALLHILAEDTHQPGQPSALERRGETIAAAAALCHRWRLSNKYQDRVCWLLAQQGELRATATKAWSLVQRLLISEGIDELIALDEAEALAIGGDAAEQGVVDEEFCRRALQLPPEKLDPDPLLDGNALAAHGVPKGPVYKWLLEKVRDAQLDREITNFDDALALVDRLLATGRTHPEE